MRMLAIDMDGTCLNDRHRISGKTLNALRMAAEAGIEIVPATGRALSCLPHQLKEEPYIRYVISSNGAVVTDKQTRFNVLNYEHILEYERNPISNIKTRLKALPSIEEKLRRRGLPTSLSSMEENLNDIAGVRAFLWLTAPFIAINLLTLGDQPTALQLVMDDVTYIGELTESTAFWAALISLVGIVLCFISTISKADAATRTFAIITEIPLAIALFDILSWADDAEEMFEALGLGFWGIFIILFIVICASKSTPSVKTDET